MVTVFGLYYADQSDTVIGLKKLELTLVHGHGIQSTRTCTDLEKNIFT